MHRTSNIFEHSRTIIGFFWVSLYYPILNFKKNVCLKNVWMRHYCGQKLWVKNYSEPEKCLYLKDQTPPWIWFDFVTIKDVVNRNIVTKWLLINHFYCTLWTYMNVLSLFWFKFQLPIKREIKSVDLVFFEITSIDLAPVLFTLDKFENDNDGELLLTSSWPTMTC